MKRVAVVYGGWSSEREVSVSSGTQMLRAAKAAGYDAVGIDATRDLARQIAEAAPDVILNGLHGPWGEDGCVQGLFEILDIPYSHSGVTASAIAMDKRKSKAVYQQAGLDVAQDVAVTREEAARAHPLKPPYVIKPVNEGSSFGVVFVREQNNGPSQFVLSDDWKYGDNLMAEEYIPGRELTVAVLGDKPLAVTEITTLREFYDFDAKYAAGGSRHVVPAEVPEHITQKALEAALKAHQALGCRGVTRSDFRFDEDKDRLVILETNTQPGMTPTSLVPEQAAYTGMPFEDLVSWMIEDASCRR
ncbi:D-alanine--D-alanine ligase [Henriciella mobilis]|uniref:D-alanine--D-alanine ligase n=1 Tax=Henriciella mobilis TaxID=2305467 RepID=UPI000E670FFE|nr:D-alanine--D-alanine ligase [Henriciella mobilis]RIJ15899.1 D-alanine--D-alanine ligase [Henriciella mobilis]RIJ21109.1 D-alanine--D-alanine ligase [Henriciella mobilis]